MRSALALSFTLALVGCDKAPPTTVVASAATTAPSALPSPPSASASSATAAFPPRACPYGWWLAGRVGDVKAYAKIARGESAVSVAYFDDEHGADVTLAGTMNGAAMKLTATVAGRKTGTLEGECDATGKLAGTWSSLDGTRVVPFSFAKPQHVAVVTRRTRVTTKGKGSADGEGACDYTLETPVVIGAASREATERAATAIAEASKELTDPTYERRARACKPEGDDGLLAYFSAGFTVERADDAVVALAISGSINVTPSAHPASFVGATVLDLDMSTGRRIAIGDVVTDEKRLVALAVDCSDGEMGSGLAEAAPEFVLLPNGVRVVGTSYAHAIAVLTFQGPELSYAWLLREGLLKKGAPNAEDWKGEAPAGKGASACRARWRP